MYASKVLMWQGIWIFFENQGLKKQALFTSTQNLKFFKILRHIESLVICMEY